ncbi:histone H1-like [Rhopalosiphum maidis]|uniref:histone H1-like n=1 Tax=Rhopalosiphum maidis TaxID=43146 RepID=UPI000EFF7658|nr:histone H1-like [Rhopalosiphum maidis]XP_026813803.1 histone H1-like [Rhopalosiphum maidis]
MSESEESVSTVSPVSSVASSPTVLTKSPVQKDVALTGVTAQRPTLGHPSTAVMVTAAIKTLNDKKGTTLQAIKKYLAVHYQMDSAKSAPYIRRYLKAAVTKGDLIQTNGTGAKGKFKLPIEAKKPAAKKKKAVVTKKKPDAKKPTAVKAVTSTKRKSIDGTTTTLSNVKKSKKVITTVVKPKPKTVKGVAKDSTAKTKKMESAANKSKTAKVVVKKVPAKKAAAPKKK